MKPTQSNKVPKMGYVGVEISKCDSNMYKVFPEEKGEWDGIQPWCQIISKLRSSFFSLEPDSFFPFKLWIEFFSSPNRAFPVVLQIDSHTVHERRGRAACGKPVGVGIICFVDSFEAVAAFFSDVHTFIHLGL